MKKMLKLAGRGIMTIGLMTSLLISPAHSVDGSFNVAGNIVNETCIVEGVVVIPPYGGNNIPARDMVIEFGSHISFDGDETTTYFVTGIPFSIKLSNCAATVAWQNVRPRFTTSGKLDGKGMLINMDKAGPQNISMYIDKYTDGSFTKIKFNESSGPATPLPTSPGNVNLNYRFSPYKTGSLPTKGGPILGIVNYEIEYL
ncbi:type 1 fimbrial protein [Klebsiella huaxiensis]|uniref:Fimbrial protein n=2 Tax=Klebsiella huaxiensis TaxID=2153354 RepID=A0ABT6E8S6_9ENTR|nr:MULTISPECIES: fimbrial protein [Klebsiella]MDG1641799.1 fimbrial protein [Klebsiella huaxiensis]QBG09611.1 type 1 fimbrial protein [Klebsiella huaxiensis]